MIVDRGSVSAKPSLVGRGERELGQLSVLSLGNANKQGWVSGDERGTAACIRGASDG